MTIKQILELIKLIVDSIKEALRQKRIRDFKDAKNKALNDRDQRLIEMALGGSSGPVDNNKYPGMSERPSKKKD